MEQENRFLLVYFFNNYSLKFYRSKFFPDKKTAFVMICSQTILSYFMSSWVWVWFWYLILNLKIIKFVFTISNILNKFLSTKSPDSNSALNFWLCMMHSRPKCLCVVHFITINMKILINYSSKSLKQTQTQELRK